MILFKVNIPCVRAAPFKGYAPRAIDVNAVTPRFAPQGMEAETGDVYVEKRRGLFEGVQPPQRPCR